MYRIKYWHQDTEESGHWALTGTMSKSTASKQSKILDRDTGHCVEVLPDAEYAICEHCTFWEKSKANWSGKCPIRGNTRSCDTCDEWTDEEGE